MKMTIVIDSDDINGIEDAYKMVRIMYTKYVGTRGYDQRSFGKIEFIKVLRIFAENIAKEQGLVKEAVDKSDPNKPRRKEEWEGLKFAKDFADKVYKAKDGGKRIGQAGVPASLLKC